MTFVRNGRNMMVVVMVFATIVVMWQTLSNATNGAKGMERSNWMQGHEDDHALETRGDHLSASLVAMNANCPPGEYYDNVRTSACALCPKNYYCPGGHAMLPCPSGTIQPRTGQATCVLGSTVCVLGQNYNFEGNPCSISGDPHQTSLFSGGGMNFMGSKPNTNQYYYVTACSGKSRKEMPFNILGTHFFLNNVVSGFDYMTLELFERSGARHLVFLNPMQLGYISNAPPSTSTLMPEQSGMTAFTSGSVVDFGGGRFKLDYTGTRRRLKAVLMVDRKAVTTITMRNGFRVMNGRSRGLAVVITPIKEFQCHACGVCGNFVERRKLPKCTGGYMKIPRGLARGGLTWQKGECQQKSAVTTEPIGCKAGSRKEVVAKRECDKQKRRYASTCGGDLVKICDRLATSCIEDVCMMGGNASLVAHGIYGQALGEIAANRDRMAKDFAAGRTQDAAREVSLACGTEDFVPYEADGIGSEMVARSRSKLRQVETKFGYGRAMKCGSNAQVLGVLSGMDMEGVWQYVGVSGKGVNKVQGELTVSATSPLTILNGISSGYIATCFATQKLYGMDVQASSRTDVRNLLLGRPVTITKTFSMPCTVPLRIFSVINSLSVRKVGRSAILQASVRSGVTQDGESATASVRFSTCTRSRLAGMGASVVAYCPSAVQGSGRLSAKFVQSGMVVVDTIFPAPNDHERVVTLRASLVPRMQCDKPHVTVGLADVDVSGGIELSVNVVSNTICATGFNVQVKSWGATNVNGLTVPYLAVCPN